MSEQLAVDGNRLRAPVLGGIAIVGPRNCDEAGLQIDVGLAEREQLTLSEPGVDGRAGA